MGTGSAFPFIYIDGVTSKSDLLLARFGDHQYVDRVNSHDILPLVMFPEKNGAAVQCQTESITGQRTRN